MFKRDYGCQEGFSHILLFILVVAAVGGTGTYFYLQRDAMRSAPPLQVRKVDKAHSTNEPVNSGDDALVNHKIDFEFTSLEVNLPDEWERNPYAEGGDFFNKSSEVGISVFVEDLTTRDSYVDSYVGTDHFKNLFYEETKQELLEQKFEKDSYEFSKVPFNGDMALQVTFSQYDNVGLSRDLMYIKGKHLYVFTLRADEQDFEKEWKDFLELLNNGLVFE